jgi:hypothetical protein
VPVGLREILLSIIHGFARTLAVSFILTTWRPVRGNGRGQARIIVEVEARACPLRRLQKTQGGVWGACRSDDSRGTRIMRRIAMDYDRLAKLAEVQLADQEAIGRKT